MSPTKQVDFITKVDKSLLGLDGMKIVVMCDRYRYAEIPNDIIFDEIGKECIKSINGKYIKDNYGEIDGNKIKELLRLERIEWIKKNRKNIEN